MLDTQFPRILGDVANPDTWEFPVSLKVVKGATPDAIVRSDPEPFVQAFIEAGRDLIAGGCSGIATTCGFLGPLRARLAMELGVPVAASALEQAAVIKANFPPDAVVGVLTISARSLSGQHLEAANVPDGTVICGVDETAFAASILGNSIHLDAERARADLVAASQAMVKEYPKVAAILLECTNMPPYALDISQVTGRPVFSIVSYLNWFHAGLRPPGFQVGH